MRTRNVQDAQLDFLVSAMHHGSFTSTEDILSWMKRQNNEVVSNIQQIPLNELKGWSYRDDRIRHDSGKFFSIDGIHIETNYRDVSEEISHVFSSGFEENILFNPNRSLGRKCKIFLLLGAFRFFIRHLLLVFNSQ